MATYTPNYNLSKPESTDDYRDFLNSYGDNMDKIDNNMGGGGGGGGHTIVDPTGTDMPQENKLQFTGAVSVSDDSANGQTVVNVEGSGGNVYGAFIDPTRVVYSSFVFDSSAHTWTATEDCILTDNMLPPDSTTAYFIRIDGKQVFAGYSTVEDPFVYVKKGQVVEYRAKSGSTMKAYGVTQGTSGIYAPVIYSDTERVIGVWRDNKPLYQKTIPFTTDSGSNITNYTHGIANIDTVVSYSGVIVRADGVSIDINDSRWQGNADDLVGCLAGKTFISVFINYSSYRNLPIYVTILYTKTTDTAGSGNWNTDGVPTHHYSTNEQVIGTWIDGKPLYEKTVSFGALPNSTSKSVAHGISDLDKIVDFSALAKRPSPFNIIPLPSSHYQSTSAQQEISFNATNITIRNGNNASAYTDVYVTLRYTKTTD